MSVKLIIGDVRRALRQLPDESIHCVVTSPPYWGLRDYGQPGQLGLEATPQEYVANMVEVFREIRRVLRADGTVWLNLGDSYFGANWRGSEAIGTKQATNRGANGSQHSLLAGDWRNMKHPVLKPKDLVGIPWRVAFALQEDGWWLRDDIVWAKPNPMPESVTDRPTKSHEYVFLLAKSREYWYDAAAVAEPIAESSKQRIGQATFDEQTGGEKDYGKNGTNPNRSARKALENFRARSDKQSQIGAAQIKGDRSSGFNERFFSVPVEERSPTRNLRDVWLIPTRPFKGAHFAVFPPALVEPCIKAGCPPAGKRCDCDVVIATPLGGAIATETGRIEDPSMTTGRAGFNRERNEDEGVRRITRREQRDYARQLKKSPYREQMAEAAGEAFAHYIRTDNIGARPIAPHLLDEWKSFGWLVEPEPCPHEVEGPGTVLDPFAGSGTVGMVAKQLGRNAILLELNPDYEPIIRERVASADQQPKSKRKAVSM